jgi:alanine racemase
VSRNTVARINLSAIRENLARVRSLAPGSQVASVVKADAYGHGLRHVVPALADSDILAVATVGEAIRCRELGWRGRLLMLEGPSNQAECREAEALSCELVIHHQSQLALLEQLRHSYRQSLWLKLDTGMHRLGFPATAARRIHDRLAGLSAGEPVVLMSHFACADDRSNPKTAMQMEAFDAAVQGLEGPCSLANSAAILNFPASHRDIVRPGILLYGVSPCRDRKAEDIGIRPAMTLQCELIAINTVEKGESVGYGGEYSCPDDMQVGVAAIGYGDGYPRGLKQGAPVLINGLRAPIIGAVSMDLTTIDLREHPEARVGDAVTLWGEGLPVEEVAQWADAIPYELICGVTARVRPVIQDG